MASKGLAVERKAGQRWEERGRKTLLYFARREHKGLFVETESKGAARLDGLIVKPRPMQPVAVLALVPEPYVITAVLEAKTRSESHERLKEYDNGLGYMISNAKVEALVLAAKYFGCPGELYVEFMGCGTVGRFRVANEDGKLFEWETELRKTQDTNEGGKKCDLVAFLGWEKMEVLREGGQK